MGQSFVIWFFFTFMLWTSVVDTDKEIDHSARKQKFSFFDVMVFQNDPCVSNDDLGRIGTCYAPRECRDKNGLASGECAQGYGVCCLFDLDCGGETRENITHWRKAPEVAGPLTGRCDAKLCKINKNICQFRLDWSTFVLASPSTSTATTHFTSYGVPVSAAAPFRIAQTNIGQCLKDTFNVRPSIGVKVPTICGYNSGHHIYIDASDATFEECTTLSFNFKEPEPTRTWNMTIIQISCDSPNKAPPGCLQYMFGLTLNPQTNTLTAQGVIKSFNFEGGFHLASQNQHICIRRERSFCAICYSQVDNVNFQDFGISGGKRRVCTYYRTGGTMQSTCNQGASFNLGQRDETLMTNTGFIRGSFEQCGGYGYKGNGDNYDFIHIPKAVVAAELFGRGNDGGFSDVQCGNGNICGRNTSGPGLCSRSTPFNLRFVSDSSEAEFEHLSASPNNRRGKLPHGSRGFRFGYLQRPCRESECFQCSMLQNIDGDQNWKIDGTILSPKSNLTIRHADGYSLPASGMGNIQVDVGICIQKECQIDLIGNGICDDKNNNVQCNFDGGDCCRSLLRDNVVSRCETCTCACTGDTTFIGDGECNDENNNVQCNFDGGDCCLDVVYDDYCDVCECIMEETPDPGCDTTLIGDGNCDIINNNLPCNFDGGDCCINGDDRDVVVKSCDTCECKCTGTLGLIADGTCDDETNNIQCNFDGGDCCGTNEEKCNCGDDFNNLDPDCYPGCPCLLSARLTPNGNTNEGSLSNFQCMTDSGVGQSWIISEKDADGFFTIQDANSMLYLTQDGHPVFSQKLCLTSPNRKSSSWLESTSI